ncbi:hypothetical protein C8R43DRAFT_969105, partial [Mycena crocata]
MVQFRCILPSRRRQFMREFPRIGVGWLNSGVQSIKGAVNSPLQLTMSSSTSTSTVYAAPRSASTSSPAKKMFTRLPSFGTRSRRAQSSPSAVSVSLPLTGTSLKSQASLDSISSCASASSTSAAASSSRPSAKLKVLDYPSACVDLVISGVSAMLIMPMPFLVTVRREKRAENALTDSVERLRGSSSTSLRRIIPRRPSTGRRRNSLVLPEVPMAQGPYVPDISQPFRFTTREAPPAMEERTVRFVVPPPRFAPPMESTAEDEEPAWCDFM